MFKVLSVVLVLCALLAGGVVSSYRWMYPTYVVRYRLTVNAAVGEQRHSGSSVIEVLIKLQPHFLPDMPPWGIRVRGEAVFVDLGESRNLVALLNPERRKGKDCVIVLFDAFHVPIEPNHAVDLTIVRGERRVDAADWPAFASFRDVANPRSIVPVDPAAIDSVLGSDVRIESVTVSTTEDPVTRRLGDALPWIAGPDYREIPALIERHFPIGAFKSDDP